MHKNCTFEKFNYGEMSNMRVYAQPTPPVYNLGAIKAKMVWYSGTGDRLADPIDVAWLAKQVDPELLIKHEVLEGYGHLSFLWGKNLTFFQGALDLAKEYSDV
jgi:hypothetical protein